MARVSVTHHIGDLAADMKSIAARAPKDMHRLTGLNAKRGNRLAKENAKRTAGAHGKHYPDAMTFEPIGLHVWEYGPDSSLPQGDMEFEHGSRNQPPHYDLAKSADVAGPLFARDVSKLPDKWFW